MKFKAIKVSQNRQEFYIFKCKASELWSFSVINQRQEDKDEGYQRVLSASRRSKLSEFIKSGNVVPGAIVVSLNAATYARGKIDIPDKPDAAWIIDGQHRAAGAALAAEEGTDIELAVVAFLNLDFQEQVDFFVTINKEAKGVPSSLYIDLLKHLPKQKTDKERLEERIADICRELTRNSESVFFQKIVSTTTPKAGQVSLTNFARRLRPILAPNNGITGLYTLPEQIQIIENYFAGLKGTFDKAFDSNLFFKTLGFGAVWRAFPLIFSATIKNSKGGFRTTDVKQTLSLVSDFDFDAWSKLGTGSGAETQAGDDLISELKSAIEASPSDSSSIRL